MGEPTPSPPSSLSSATYPSLSRNPTLENPVMPPPPLAAAAGPDVAVDTLPVPKTPELTPVAFTKSTPVVIKHARSAHGIYGTLPQARLENLKDIGQQIFEVSIDGFFRRTLPAVDDHEINDIMRQLRNAGILDRSTDEWLHFKRHGEPKDQVYVESTVFEPLGDLVEAIIAAMAVIDPDRKPQFKYFSTPDSSPESAQSRNASRPDGYFVLASESDDLDTTENINKPWWRNITLVGEVKKADSVEARNDDVSKCLWGMNHAMREDLHRRFIYGFTIENTTTRLWFSDRSQIVVSDPFDFVTETHHLVRLFNAFLYSAPVALGWDPTMTVVGKGNKRNLSYDVEVGPRKYRIGGPQVHDAAISLMGRCTRVWKGKEVLDDGRLSSTTSVIKDTWTDVGRKREGEFYDIVEDLPLTPEEKAALKGILLTKICHSDVIISGKADTTLDLTDLTSRGTVFDIVWRGPVKDPQPRYSCDVTPSSYHYIQENVLPKPIIRGQMVHNRIVFKEFGTPLSQTNSLVQVFKSIATVADGLFLLHQCGWVHRDISANNILVCEDGSTKLVDFEYAKHCTDGTTHTMRTGTPNFMAIEVDFQEYLFYSPGNIQESSESRSSGKPRTTKPSREAEWKLLNALNSENVAVDVPDHPAYQSSVPADAPAFVYNPLHDLESLEWTGIYMLCDRQVIVSKGNKRPATDYAQLDKQHEWARRLFHNSKERRWFMTQPSKFTQLVESLDPQVQPLGFFLRDVHAALLERYMEVERDVKSIDFSVARGLYMLFKPAWHKINLRDFEGIQIGLIDYSALTEERAKRRRLE